MPAISVKMGTIYATNVTATSSINYKTQKFLRFMIALFSFVFFNIKSFTSGVQSQTVSIISVNLKS